MGDLRPNNGGGMPPDDGGGAYPGDLPDFPPEWGTIVIPDDAVRTRRGGACAAPGAAARFAPRPAAQRLRAGVRPDQDAPSLGVPVVIMAVAVLTTLVSLFVVTWDHRSLGDGAGRPGARHQPPTCPWSASTLADAGGARVQLGDVLPAVLLLVRRTATARALRGDRGRGASRRSRSSQSIALLRARSAPRPMFAAWPTRTEP